jgi:predicted lysophospholipase L1 biosynthesis ABC-type transport system permease subunit
MRFVLLTALRETRSGVEAAGVFLRVHRHWRGRHRGAPLGDQSVRGVLSTEAQTLIASDILLTTDRPWQSGTVERIAARVAKIPGAQQMSSTEMATMARPADESDGKNAVARVVELRAVQPGFPFYGQLTLQDGHPTRTNC